MDVIRVVNTKFLQMGQKGGGGKWKEIYAVLDG